ncbi:MAG TPA: aconitase family protein, partial [Candidatus Polarisedimenticolaceae bacterium]|nr:aconitase family protein [Candidatus Polarisedimenticolaceae bacterium]
AIWATGEFWWRVPPTVRVVLRGGLRGGAVGKDVIIALCSFFRRGEVRNAAVEFGGPGVDGLTIDDRLAIANMTTEWGALVGWFPPDGAVEAFLAGLEARRTEPVGPPLEPDPAARYAGTISLDLDSVCPHVAGPDQVSIARPLGEVQSQRIRVDKAYLVSCANSRASDLAAAAEALGGRSVADGVTLYVSAASALVQRQAERDGSWARLLEAGAKPLPPGCGPCIGLGAGLLAPGEVGVSATNRNFKGRMGSPDARCYLASPAVVAASAAAGYIRGPAARPRARLRAAFALSPDEPDPAAGSELLDGFPASLRGRLLFIALDDVVTDRIFPGRLTYREDLSRAAIAAAAFADLDPSLAPRMLPGDLLVTGRGFGGGSSREQAVTALQAAGVAAVVAASFSSTYLRNALNNGFLCIESPATFEYLRARFGANDPRPVRVTDEQIEVDFASRAIVVHGRSFAFLPPGPVGQRLLLDGGIERSVRRRVDALRASGGGS